MYSVNAAENFASKIPLTPSDMYTLATRYVAGEYIADLEPEAWQLAVGHGDGHGFFLPRKARKARKW